MFLRVPEIKPCVCNAGDPSSIPGSGRPLGEGIGYPLQYSGLQNSMDCIFHGVTKSQTQLSDFHFTNCNQIFHLPEGLQVFFKRDQIGECFSISVKSFKNHRNYSNGLLFGRNCFLFCIFLIFVIRRSCRSSQEEISHVQGQEQRLRGDNPHPRSGAVAKRRYPRPG